MRQEEIEYVSGSSQAGLSTRAVVGATIFGNKRSARQVGNWITGYTKRQYKRRRLVWVCADVCSSNFVSATPAKGVTRSRSNQKPLSDEQEMLAWRIKHIEDMFGEMFLYSERWSTYKSKIGELKSLTDAEARVFRDDLTEIESNLIRRAKILGYIYNHPGELRAAVNLFFRILNPVMWCVGIYLGYQYYQT
jgi:hypothetical protein